MYLLLKKLYQLVHYYNLKIIYFKNSNLYTDIKPYLININEQRRWNRKWNKNSKFCMETSGVKTKIIIINRVFVSGHYEFEILLTKKIIKSDSQEIVAQRTIYRRYFNLIVLDFLILKFYMKDWFNLILGVLYQKFQKNPFGVMFLLQTTWNLSTRGNWKWKIF